MVVYNNHMNDIAMLSETFFSVLSVFIIVHTLIFFNNNNSIIENTQVLPQKMRFIYT